MREQCVECSGQGIVDDPDHDGEAIECDWCEGTGWVDDE